MVEMVGQVSPVHDNDDDFWRPRTAWLSKLVHPPTCPSVPGGSANISKTEMGLKLNSTTSGDGDGDGLGGALPA